MEDFARRTRRLPHRTRCMSMSGYYKSGRERCRVHPHHSPGARLGVTTSHAEITVPSPTRNCRPGIKGRPRPGGVATKFGIAPTPVVAPGCSTAAREHPRRRCEGSLSGSVRTTSSCTTSTHKSEGPRHRRE